MSKSRLLMPLLLGLPLVMTAAGLLALFSPWGFERFTATYPLAMTKLSECDAALAALGENPRRAWGFSNFRIGSSGQTGTARFTTKLRGDRGRAEYQYTSSRTFDRWALTSAKLFLLDEKRVLDVMSCRTEPPPGATPREFFEALCENGDASACFMLRTMYEAGTNGVPRDAERARSYAERACSLGLEAACGS